MIIEDVKYVRGPAREKPGLTTCITAAATNGDVAAVDSGVGAIPVDPPDVAYAVGAQLRGKNSISKGIEFRNLGRSARFWAQTERVRLAALEERRGVTLGGNSNEKVCMTNDATQAGASAGNVGDDAYRSKKVRRGYCIMKRNSRCKKKPQCTVLCVHPNQGHGIVP